MGSCCSCGKKAPDTQQQQSQNYRRLSTPPPQHPDQHEVINTLMVTSPTQTQQHDLLDFEPQQNQQSGAPLASSHPEVAAVAVPASTTDDGTASVDELIKNSRDRDSGDAKAAAAAAGGSSRSSPESKELPPQQGQNPTDEHVEQQQQQEQQQHHLDEATAVAFGADFRAQEQEQQQQQQPPNSNPRVNSRRPPALVIEIAADFAVSSHTSPVILTPSGSEVYDDRSPDNNLPHHFSDFGDSISSRQSSVDGSPPTPSRQRYAAATRKDMDPGLRLNDDEDTLSSGQSTRASGTPDSRAATLDAFEREARRGRSASLARVLDTGSKRNKHFGAGGADSGAFEPQESFTTVSSCGGESRRGSGSGEDDSGPGAEQRTPTSASSFLSASTSSRDPDDDTDERSSCDNKRRRKSRRNNKRK